MTSGLPDKNAPKTTMGYVFCKDKRNEISLIPEYSYFFA